MNDLNTIAGFEVISTLGHGAGSVIFKVRDSRDNRCYALKRVDIASPKDQRHVDQAVLEHRIAQQFDHQSLRRCYRLIRLRAIVRTIGVVVIMELVEGQTLEAYRPGNFAELMAILRRLARGLNVMHQHGYVHADMKPNNVLIDHKRQIKLIDFGQSCRIGTVKARIQGTPDYIAPEQVCRQPITARTDVFNLGATMYWMLTGQHVLTSLPQQGQVGTPRPERQPCLPPIELNGRIPPALSSLVMGCIEPEPERRPHNMEHVLDRLDIAAHQLPQRAA